MITTLCVHREHVRDTSTYKGCVRPKMGSVCSLVLSCLCTKSTFNVQPKV